MVKEKDARRAGSLATEQRDGLKNGNQLLSADTFSHCSRGDVEEARLRRIRALVGEGRDLVRSCPDAWEAALTYVRECARSKRPVLWHDVASVMLARDYIDQRTGKNVAVNNTLGPLLMRWLVDLCPEARPYFKPRRSMFNELGVGGPYD